MTAPETPSFAANCPVALSLQFCRHSQVKFKEVGADDGKPAANSWEVLGKYDYLTVRTHKSLEELTLDPDQRPDAPRIWDARPVNAPCGVVFVPFGDFQNEMNSEESSRDYKSFLSRTVMPPKETSDSSGDSPLLYVAQFTLSPAVHQLFANYDGVLVLLDEVRNYIRSEYAEYCSRKILPQLEPETKVPSLEYLKRFCIFRSLGASDLAIVALPATPDELCSLVDFVRHLRSTRLNSLLTSDSAGQDRERFRVEYRGALDAIKGHAFAFVDETIAYRQTLTQTGEREFSYGGDGSADFPSRERAWQMKIHTDLLVDCGHEYQSSMPTGVYTPGRHTIRASFDGLIDFVRNWGNRLNVTMYADNLLDSQSTMSLSETRLSSSEVPTERPEEDVYSRAWRLKPDFMTEIQNYCSQIEAWSQVLNLPADQRRELAALLLNFRMSFGSMEAATALRDLIPFMRQLAACCSQTVLWQQYLGFRKPTDGDNSEKIPHSQASRNDHGGLSQTEKENLKEDLMLLIAHLGRAMQNRLEVRAEHADPTIYRTLEHGAGKTVPAYSAMYWLASELLGRQATSSSQSRDHCPADNMAVCVAIGHRGHFYYTEIFSEFRAFALSQEQTNDKCCWTAPLVLLDISGDSIFRPSQQFHLCLHETILFSDWIVSQCPQDIQDYCRSWGDLYAADRLRSLRHSQGATSSWQEKIQTLGQNSKTKLAEPSSELSQEAVVGPRQPLLNLSNVKGSNEPETDVEDLYEKIVAYCRSSISARKTPDPREYLPSLQAKLEELVRTRVLASYEGRQEEPADRYEIAEFHKVLDKAHDLVRTVVCKDPIFSEMLDDTPFREEMADRLRLRIVLQILKSTAHQGSALETANHLMFDTFRAHPKYRGRWEPSTDGSTAIDRLMELQQLNQRWKDLTDFLTHESNSPLHPQQEQNILHISFPEGSAEQELLQHLTNLLALDFRANPFPARVVDPVIKLKSTMAQIDVILRLWAKSCRLGCAEILETFHAQS